MKQIELEIWNPSPENPSELIYNGQRKAQEVFAELKQRLESVGMLPDEYFDLDDQWENGREIPKDALIYGTFMYGENEGIYLDVYIRWDEEGKRNRQSFITGKTLGESESHLDRMYLTASAINKALYSNEQHARYMVIGGKDNIAGDTVMHLNGAERRLLIDSLVERRNQMLEETKTTEHLLRRVVGSITEFVNEVGAKPLQISDFDMAILAVEDGNLAAFIDTCEKLPNDKVGDLLICAAGRPGRVGYEMTSSALFRVDGVSNEVYLTACKNAIATGDLNRVLMLADNAPKCVSDFDKGFHCAIIGEAMLQKQGKMPHELIKLCTSEQIRAGNPYILAQAMFNRNSQIAYALAEKGIDMTYKASDLIHSLRYHRDDWMLKHLLERGMELSNSAYIPAFAACIKLDSEEMGKVLIDRGMDFAKYEQWVGSSAIENTSNGTFAALKQYWTDTVKPELEEPPIPAKPEKKDLATRIAEGKAKADAHNTVQTTPDTPRRSAGNAEIT